MLVARRGGRCKHLVSISRFVARQKGDYYLSTPLEIAGNVTSPNINDVSNRLGAVESKQQPVIASSTCAFCRLAMQASKRPVGPDDDDSF